ncbi:MAG TPA: NAD(P)-dependent alcohol dehydrogenase [Steroidobacteraceae bacterium]|jgi:NADPH:quinone reductase-like Zn-dependent oxidoreductase|nr:NAD(P)-dependent alcohol dehydrogenase [Steroidobacteraceae bacterium]
MSLPEQQRRCTLIRQTDGSYRLTFGQAPIPEPAHGEVLVRVRATSLNRRDVYVLKGQYPMPPRPTLVPLSDGAGDVVSVGSGVTRFKISDRVAGSFFQRWLKGRPDAEIHSSALGGQLDGMLSEYVCLSQDGLVGIPQGYSYEEAATLPCAAVTAWNGLITRGRMHSGDNVLLLGTGGVSIFGLQFAAATGARAIVTSSSDDKLTRAATLGAASTINYVNTPEWSGAVRAATDNVGVHQVLEVGGTGTLPQSIASLAPGGHIALIGGLSGFGGDIPARMLMHANATVSGIYVGSRANFEAMNAFIERHRIRPVIDRVYALDEALAAYERVDAGRHLGKVVIKL